MPRKYAELKDVGGSGEQLHERKFEEMDVDSDPELDGSKRKSKRCARVGTICRWTIVVCVLLQVIVLSIIILAMKGYVDLPYINANNTSTNATIINTSAIFVLNGMDRSADPCTDFYTYACGAWINSYQLPDDEASHTRSFGDIRDQNSALLSQLMQLTPDSEQLGRGSYLATAYRLCTDTDRLDGRGLAPLQPYYERVQAVDSVPALATLLGQLSVEGMSLGAFFSLSVGVDDMDPNRYLLSLWQSGLTLPDPSYYQRDTTALSAWMGQVFAASPDGDLNSSALAELVTLESQLAVVMYSPSQNRDVDQIYNNVSVTEARTQLGQLASFLDAFSLQSDEQVNLAQLNYFRALGLVVSRRSLDTLKNYVKLRLYAHTFHMLGEPQRTVSHAYREMIYGTSSVQPRDEYCVSAVSAAMPQLTGYYFVQQSNISVDEAREILENVEQAYSDAFDELSWMDAATARAAEEKLEAITNKVGWPESWPDFEAFYGGVLFSDYFEFQRSLACRAGEQELLQRNQTVDRAVWGMSPSAAMNYGGIGVVQGHELGHAFDDGGSRYDGQGYLRDWWTSASRTLFETEVQCVEQQFSSYEVAPGVNVQGSLVVGEALGDIGGVVNAFAAYRAWREDSDPDNTEEELARQYFNMSADELFFVAFGQVWCSVANPEYLVMLTSTNPHPPGSFRVQGTLTDANPQFSEVFGCTAGDTYNPSDSCDVW